MNLENELKKHIRNYCEAYGQPTPEGFEFEFPELLPDFLYALVRALLPQKSWETPQPWSELRIKLQRAYVFEYFSFSEELLFRMISEGLEVNETLLRTEVDLDSVTPAFYPDPGMEADALFRSMDDFTGYRGEDLNDLFCVWHPFEAKEKGLLEKIYSAFEYELYRNGDDFPDLRPAGWREVREVLAQLLQRQPPFGKGKGDEIRSLREAGYIADHWLDFFGSPTDYYVNVEQTHDIWNHGGTYLTPGAVASGAIVMAISAEKAGCYYKIWNGYAD